MANLGDKVHTVNALMKEAGKALAKRDIDALEELDDISAGWLQPEEERISQITMLNSMLEIVYAIEELEELDEYDYED